jgi:hypothetical protein
MSQLQKKPDLIPGRAFLEGGKKVVVLNVLFTTMKKKEFVQWVIILSIFYFR